MEGRILGNRYELLERIGGGGMALVYKAKCRLLNRFVAVKILRTEFTGDEEFVKRFRIEAQAAASLSHPNIVSIHDVGREDDVHYIVMEYVDGITLKQYINEKGPLDWREAVDITIQICSAIEHAHRNNIVHRDIKPHNILLTREGIAKVADFGIARAVSSSTITMVGSTIGSVHYFSPEQARGGFTDEKSDLYSLGIGLYEMVTGRLPFDGDTPVAVALKHIQDEAEKPIEINSGIPRSVNDIILRAIKKDQSKRYQSASEMLHDLYKALKDPEGAFAAGEDMEDSPTRRMQAVGNGSVTARKDEKAFEEEEDMPVKKVKKKGDRFAVGFGIIVSLLIIGVFSYVGYSIVIPSIWPEPPKEFVVKNYGGRDISEVKDELAKAGVDVRDKRRPDDNIPKDIIISQKPEAGKTIKLGGYNYIELEVSDGPQLVKMVDLKKIDYRDAESKIKDMGLMPRTDEEFSDTIPEGLVTRTDPDAGQEIKLGSVVTIFKSRGPELRPTKVPDMTGKTESEAQKLLADAKLTLGKIFPEGISNPTAKVIKQDPAAYAEVKESTPVNLYFESSQRKVINRIINLSRPESYKETIKVRAEITPSDTNTPEILMNEVKNKTDFPLTISIPVPDKGKTDVKIFLDDVLYAEFPEEISGG